MSLPDTRLEGDDAIVMAHQSSIANRVVRHVASQILRDPLRLTVLPQRPLNVGDPRDVFLPLSGVDTVTLSACETGLREVVGGEGLIGVRLAVAGTTVARLWKVNNIMTRRLVKRFYHNLWEKVMPRLEALREAQLWMLREGARAADEVGARGVVFVDWQPSVGDGLPPYYWAPSCTPRIGDIRSSNSRGFTARRQLHREK